MLPQAQKNGSSVSWDANASYPVLPEVRVRLAELLGSEVLACANPSSVHKLGQRARFEIESARDELFKLLGCNRNEYQIVFTSGATEANNFAINSSIAHWKLNSRKQGADFCSVVTTAVEHLSVLEPLRAISEISIGSSGIQIRAIAPNQGNPHWYSSADLLAAVDDSTALVSVMGANNEVGTLLPIWELASDIECLRQNSNSRHPIVHCDGVQLVGKTELKLAGSGIDLFTLSGHKFGALPGAGALLIRKGIDLISYQLGGSQESKLRGGTENLLGIVSLGIAAKLAREQLTTRVSRMRHTIAAIRTLLMNELGDRIEFITPDYENSTLPNTLAVHIPGCNGSQVVVAADLAGVCVSTGSACSSGKLDPSHVLLALGYNKEAAGQMVRISISGDCNSETVAETGAKLVAAIKGQIYSRQPPKSGVLNHMAIQ